MFSGPKFWETWGRPQTKTKSFNLANLGGTVPAEDWYGAIALEAVGAEMDPKSFYIPPDGDSYNPRIVIGEPFSQIRGNE